MVSVSTNFLVRTIDLMDVSVCFNFRLSPKAMVTLSLELILPNPITLK